LLKIQKGKVSFKTYVCRKMRKLSRHLQHLNSEIALMLRK